MGITGRASQNLNAPGGFDLPGAFFIFLIATFSGSIFTIAIMEAFKLNEYSMILRDYLGHLGKESFTEAFLKELSHGIAVSEDELPLRKLASPGWCPSVNSRVRIEKLEWQDIGGGLIQGSFMVSFQEFMQRDCQDVMTEGRHSGRMNFRLNVATGQIEFTAEQYPTREYDPEEF